MLIDELDFVIEIEIDTLDEDFVWLIETESLDFVTDIELELFVTEIETDIDDED